MGNEKKGRVIEIENLSDSFVGFSRGDWLVFLVVLASLFCFEGAHHAWFVGILVPRPGIELWPLVIKTWSPNHWATSKFPPNLSDSLKIVRAEALGQVRWKDRRSYEIEWKRMKLC